MGLRTDGTSIDGSLPINDAVQWLISSLIIRYPRCEAGMKRTEPEMGGHACPIRTFSNSRRGERIWVEGLTRTRVIWKLCPHQLFQILHKTDIVRQSLLYGPEPKCGQCQSPHFFKHGPFFQLQVRHFLTRSPHFLNTKSAFWYRSYFIKRLKFMIGKEYNAYSRGGKCLHDSIVVSIPACHAGDRGSIPRRGASFLFFEKFEC